LNLDWNALPAEQKMDFSVERDLLVTSTDTDPHRKRYRGEGILVTVRANDFELLSQVELVDTIEHFDTMIVRFPDAIEVRPGV
jgi:hypothetical protein